MNKNKIDLLKMHRFHFTNVTAWFMLLPFLLLTYLIIWRPVALGAWMSMFKLNGYTPEKFVGLYNYKKVMSDTLFLRTLVNTCKYVGWSLLLGFFTPVILAIMINEMAHFKSTIKFCIYLPCIVPAVASALIWYFMYYPDTGGLLNMVLSHFGIGPLNWLQNSKLTIPLIVVSMTWKGMGATTIMYLASLQSISQDLYEAARVDGAGVMSRIFHITLPSIAPVMMLFLIKQMISVFQTMEVPLVMTGGGPNDASLTLSLQGYYYAFNYFQPERALALGFITFIILIVLTMFYFFINKKLDVE